MLSHIFHKTLDDQQAHDKADDAAHHQNTDLGTGGTDAGQQELQTLDGGSAQHGGDGHKEGEFRTGTSAHADHNSAQDGAAAAGRAGDQAEALEQADHQGSLHGDVVDILHHPKMPARILPLHQNEGDAVDDEHDAHHDAVVQMGIHPVVKQHTHHAGGNDGGDDFEPQVPGLLLFGGRLAGSEGVQLMEKQHDDSHNGTQLDDHVKHGLEFFRNIQIDELIQQNQMTRGRNGQPLGDALHNAEENGF